MKAGKQGTLVGGNWLQVRAGGRGGFT